MIADSAAVSACFYTIVKNLRKYAEFGNLSERQVGQLALFRRLNLG